MDGIGSIGAGEITAGDGTTSGVSRGAMGGDTVFGVTCLGSGLEIDRDLVWRGSGFGSVFFEFRLLDLDFGRPRDFERAGADFCCVLPRDADRPRRGVVAFFPLLKTNFSFNFSP